MVVDSMRDALALSMQRSYVGHSAQWMHAEDGKGVSAKRWKAVKFEGFIGLRI